jgi:hypothetical protein
MRRTRSCARCSGSIINDHPDMVEVKMGTAGVVMMTNKTLVLPCRDRPFCGQRSEEFLRYRCNRAPCSYHCTVLIARAKVPATPPGSDLGITRTDGPNPIHGWRRPPPMPPRMLPGSRCHHNYGKGRTVLVRMRRNLNSGLVAVAAAARVDPGCL